MGMLDLDCPEEIETHTMEEYANDYLNLRRKGMFASLTTVNKILSHKKKMIKRPLRVMPEKSMDEPALQIFKNITGFMGDRSSKKEGGGHAEKMMKTLLTAPEELRDEAYTQLVKQTTNNPSPDSLFRGWQLFSILSGSILPSPEFTPFLKSYFFSAMQTTESGGDGEPSIHDHAKFALARLSALTAQRPRREVPPVMEIEATKLILPVLVRVYLVDGTYETMPITSMSNAVDVRNMMAELLGISPLNARGLAVYEMTDEMEERCLDEGERIMDVIAYWQRDFDEAKQAGKKMNDLDQDPYRLVLKVKHYFTPIHTPERDDAAEELLYKQAVFDVVCDRYPCGERDCVKLAALQRQAEKPGEDIPDEQLGRYLRNNLCKSSKRAEYLGLINRALQTISHRSASDCRVEYLSTVQDWTIYGSSFFPVEPQLSTRFGDRAFVAINPRGVMIINPDTKEAIAEFAYTQIPTWGHSPMAFVLHVGNLIRQEKLYFKTPDDNQQQGKEMNDLVKAYVNEMVDQQERT
jgi:hypothetical protein